MATCVHLHWPSDGGGASPGVVTGGGTSPAQTVDSVSWSVGMVAGSVSVELHSVTMSELLKQYSLTQPENCNGELHQACGHVMLST